MNECFHGVHLEHQEDHLSDTKPFGWEIAKKVNDFHRSFPEYSVTPLAKLSNLAAMLGLSNIYVKDESYRFGLNAFKVLGGSYAIGNYIAGKLGLDISQLPYAHMISREIKEQLGDITFVTATDGNHGRGVAWTANRLGQKSVVYMPRGTAPERLKNIKALGSDASITDLCYDDAVRLAKAGAEKYGWVLVQDTSWEGYEEIPRWIMQGYTTLAYEVTEQLHGEKPTHVFLQAGVGSMGGAIAGFFADYYGDNERPIITVVEPNKADCLFRTAQAQDGQLHFVTDNMDSIMAGLCCGEPCGLSWEIFQDHADNFVSIPDYVTAKGMRILGNALGDDPRVVSGESGACTVGLIYELMRNPGLTWLREQIKLDQDSKVLCFSTEGATDRENYRKIVWDGLYPGY